MGSRLYQCDHDGGNGDADGGSCIAMRSGGGDDDGSNDDDNDVRWLRYII